MNAPPPIPPRPGRAGGRRERALVTLVVDDHALVRSGMRRLLEENPRIGEITEAGSGEEALTLARETPFEMILMDIALPGMSGLEAAGRLLAVLPDALVIMVTGKIESGPIRRLLASGVRGYVTKGSEATEMDQAIRRVLAGERYLSPDVARQLALDTIDGAEENPFDRLTSREHEVIGLLLRGRRNRQIAASLFISEKTVSTHRTRAFEKLGIGTTADLVRLAMRHGLWDENDEP